MRPVKTTLAFLCCLLGMLTTDARSLQPEQAPSLCPLPKSSEEALKLRLKIMGDHASPNFGLLAALAYKAGHAGIIQEWNKSKFGLAGGYEVSLSSLPYWLEFGFEREAEDILETQLPLIIESFIVPAAAISNRTTLVRALLKSTRRPHGAWLIKFLVNTGRHEDAVSIYQDRKFSPYHTDELLIISKGMRRAGKAELLRRFLLEQRRQMDAYIAGANDGTLTDVARFNWGRLLTLRTELARIGEPDPLLPDPPNGVGPPPLRAIAAMIAAYTITGKQEIGDRLRRWSLDRIEEEHARRQRSKLEKRTMTSRDFAPVPSVSEFNSWITLEMALLSMSQGNHETGQAMAEAELARATTSDYQDHAIGDFLLKYAAIARLRKDWSATHRLVDAAERATRGMVISAMNEWIVGAGDALKEKEMIWANQWIERADRLFCSLGPNRSDPKVGSWKGFVLAYLETRFVLAAILEERLPPGSYLLN